MRLLGEVTLRNPRRVFADGATFVVESEDRRGAVYRTRVPTSVVAALHTIVGGQEVSAAEAADLLEPVARELGIPYTYGHKLRFYAQDVLIVLIARGDATLRKLGREYRYSVSP